MCRIGTLAVKRWGCEANSACERLRLDSPVTIQVLVFRRWATRCEYSYASMLANGMTSLGGRHEISSVRSYPIFPGFPPFNLERFPQHIWQPVRFPVPRPNTDPSIPE